MPLDPGTRFGAYEIESSLGAGGMGEVYRARDTKLGRLVAIKVLPPHLADDPERIARFEREAKALAALNHPRIATLYGLEHDGGRHLLVMELVEGHTLAELLQRGRLAVEETIGIALQLADALEAAHEKGIVHRDLKPANIKLTPDHVVKVLDFGLAKAVETESTATNLTHSPTLSMMATQAGVILGTAAYMSPEQAKGAPADHRSDIFSFGVVLVEMLTGRQPFRGETAPEILASVLVRDADLSGLSSNLNPRLVDLVRRCLDKNPKKRWQAIGDVRAELEIIAAAPTSVAVQAAGTAPSRWMLTAAILATAIIVAALTTAAAVWTLQPAPAPAAPVARFSFSLPAGQLFTNTGRQLLAISPDGRQIVYVANRQLFLRRLAELDASPVKGTEPSARPVVASGEGINSPVFSPDGQFLAYYGLGERAIKKVSASGGTPTTLCTATNPFGMTWGPSGIVFSDGPNGIMRVASDGGQPERIVAVKAGETAHRPQMLPDNTSVLFTVSDSSNKSRVVVQTLSSADRKTLIEDAWDGRYLSTGHLLFIREGVVFAAPFDARRLTTTAAAVPVVEGVRRTTGIDLVEGQFSISSTGSLVYLPGPATVSGNQRRLVVLDSKGGSEVLDVPPAAYASPRISPDGKWLAVDTDDGNDSSIWLYPLSGASSIRRLTLAGRNRFPTWSADSSAITFQSDREGDAGLFWQKIDAGVAERLTKAERGAAHVPESWSPDGKTLLFAVARDGLFLLHAYTRSEHRIEAFGGVQNVYMPSAVFSPDGQWVAYYSRPRGSETGSLVVQSSSSADTKHEVHKGGGIHPFWSRRRPQLQLFYRLPTRLESVELTTSPTFGFSKPVVIPVLALADNPAIARKMDPMPDGEHFITVDQANQVESGARPDYQVQVVLNWIEELKQRVPAR